MILVMDNARYHHFKGIEEHMKELKNIRPMYLPAYCSELNPIEHLWKNLRTVVTHNTLFESFNNLIEQINVYFEDIKIDKDRISKLCAYIH